MAIINNANPGSQINLLCMIYRVLARNPNKYTKAELYEVCRPASLFRKDEHKSRFRLNLDFWLKPVHQLWKVDENECYYLVHPVSSVTPLVEEIAKVVLKVLLQADISGVLQKDSNDIEPLLRTLSFVLSQQRFCPFGEELTSSTLDNSLKSHFNQYQLNNESRTPFLEYGHFLGFLELKPGTEGVLEYVVDPTMAIQRTLTDIFTDKYKLSASDFLSRLSIKLPVLDGGIHRLEVEACLSDRSENPDETLSRAVSHALQRLQLSGLIRCEASSDDSRSLQLNLPYPTKPFSQIQYIKGALSC
jgi:hypothetical protein